MLLMTIKLMLKRIEEVLKKRALRINNLSYDKEYSNGFTTVDDNPDVELAVRDGGVPTNPVFLDGGIIIETTTDAGIEVFPK